MSVSQRVTAELERTGMTRKDLAKRSGLSVNWLSKLLNGHAAWTNRTISKVAGALGKSATWLETGKAIDRSESAQIRELAAQLEEAQRRVVESELAQQRQFSELQDARRREAEVRHALAIRQAEVRELEEFTKTLRMQLESAHKQQRLAVAQVKQLKRMLEETQRKADSRGALLGVGGAVAALFGLSALANSDDGEDPIPE